jgi:GST-like protein
VAKSKKSSSKSKAPARPAKKQKKTPPPKRAAAPAPKKNAAPAKAPIQLYYWPTPNGWKISIMLMPAIVDPAGPGGKPISVFESGAILQYLGRKTGKFYPADERGRVAVDEWLFWQMAGLGPMTGQANHFLNYAKDGNDYARKRYVDEVHRLLGVMNKQLGAQEYLAGAYSIADMACWGWVIGASRMHDIAREFPHVKTWREKIGKRPAVERGFALGRELREQQNADPKAQEEAQRILFGQRART